MAKWMLYLVCILILGGCTGGESPTSISSIEKNTDHLQASSSNPPTKSRNQREYDESHGIVRYVPVKQKVIALTFDDGPNPKYTSGILDSLKRYHAKATFFVVGENAKTYPELVQREIAEGHEVGNHTYSHPDNIRRLSTSQIEKEIMRTQAVIISITKLKENYLFRPIGGNIDNNVIKPAEKNGYTIILWSWWQDTRDWSRPGVSKIVKRVVNNPRNGDIVLFHDSGGNRSQTVEAIKQILPKLQEKGFKFVTISELLKMKRK